MLIKSSKITQNIFTINPNNMSMIKRMKMFKNKINKI